MRGEIVSTSATKVADCENRTAPIQRELVKVRDIVERGRLTSIVADVLGLMEYPRNALSD